MESIYPKRIMEDSKTTVLQCSTREYKFRWWCWGIYATIVGVLMGYIIWGL